MVVNGSWKRELLLRINRYSSGICWRLFYWKRDVVNKSMFSCGIVEAHFFHAPAEAREETRERLFSQRFIYYMMGFFSVSGETVIHFEYSKTIISF